MNRSQEAYDTSFYFSAIEIASQDDELSRFMALYVSGEADHDSVESFVHDEGFVGYINKRYGLAPDLATSAFLLCHKNALVTRYNEQNTGTL